jgi:16S rRNA processing protein RimM
MKEFITIGRITKPYGVKGEVIVRNESRWYEPFMKLKKVLAESGNERINLEIEGIRDFKDRIAIKFKGIDNPEKAAEYRNMDLKIPRNEMPELPEEEFYGFEIIGFELFDDKNKCYGKVVDIVNLPANDALIVRTDDETEIMIPAVKSIIKQIDVTAKKVVIGSFEEFTA